jgi:hypothetical protein
MLQRNKTTGSFKREREEGRVRMRAKRENESEE